MLQGLWFGIMCGLVVQMLLLLLITLWTNWEKEVNQPKLLAMHKSTKTPHYPVLLIVLLASRYLEFLMSGL